MKKRNFIIIGSLLLLAIIVTVYITQSIYETTSEQNDIENNSQQDQQNNHSEKQKTPYEKYIHDGEKCLEIDDTIERGDCFQEIGENYGTWYVNEEKSEFYFPYQYEQDHWSHVFYREIDENDGLGESVEDEYYDEYEDPYASHKNYERGEEVLETYWHILSNMIPRKYRESLTALYWTYTGEDVVLAVGRNDPDSQYLLFSHLLRSEYVPEIRYTLLHELGHILTLDSSQVDSDERLYDEDYDEKAQEQIIENIENNCETFYHNGRCAKEDSYLYEYYQQFWQDINKEHQNINWEDEKDYKEFFNKYEDRFFNSYQGTSPTEDIADMFSYFVHSHSSISERSDIKHEKINFFYHFDKLINLRTSILENLYHLAIEDQKIY